MSDEATKRRSDEGVGRWGMEKAKWCPVLFSSVQPGVRVAGAHDGLLLKGAVVRAGDDFVGGIAVFGRVFRFLVGWREVRGARHGRAPRGSKF